MQVRLHNGQSGFSLLEMLFATIILLVGLVAVAELVPASILLNYRNRMDSSALVFAQRELDQFLDRPLSSVAFTDTDGNLCSLGNPASPNQVVGSPLVNGQLLIDFGQAPQPGYSFTSLPDANGASYDVRWPVIVMGNGSTASAKRFILGIRQQGGSGYFLPVTLDAMISK